MNKRILPRSAGFGFVSAVIISLLIFNFSHIVEYYHVYLSIYGIMLVGLYDDKFDISHCTKFLGIIIAVLFVCLNGVNINSLGVYSGHEMSLPMWFAAIFIVFGMVGFTIQLVFSIIGYQMRAGDQILSLVLFMLLMFIFLNLFDQRHKYREKKKKKKKKIVLNQTEEISS